MADFFKGLAGGFGTGLQFGQAMRQRRMEDDLAQAYAKPEEFTDYTPEQQRQIRELQASGAYDVSAIPGAEGAAPTLRYAPRQGLDLQGDMPAVEGAYIDVAPQQVQRYGGQTTAGRFDPTQLRGLQMQEASRVLGSYGDVRGAAALQAQAAEQEYRAEDRAYQARIRPEQEKQLLQQGILTQGQIDDRQKLRDREVKVETVDTDVAGFMSKRLTGPDGEMRQPSMDDNIAALQYRATALQKAGLNKEATDSLKDYQGFAVNQIRLDEAQRNSQLGAVAAAIAQGDLGPAKAFYDRFVVDGAKVIDMKTDPKTGAITVSRVRDDGTKLPDKVIKGGANELLAALNSFKDPMSLYNFSQNEFTNNLKTEELGLRKKTEARLTASAAQDKLSPVEKNLATLQRLGIPVSPEDVRAMAGIKPEKLSPEAAAQLEAITANLKGNESPKALAEARAAITDLFRGEGLKQRNTTIVRGLKTANSKNDLPAAIKQLRDAGVGDETIVGLAKQAGVTLPPSFAPAAAAPAPATAPAAAVSPRTGLSSGQQQYGPLTPMATIEADARAGVPAAVAYLKQMADRDRAKTENAIRAAQGE